VKILGIDIGLAAMGWALVDVGSGDDVVGVRAGVWTTKKETKKRQLHVGSDDARRLDDLIVLLWRTALECDVAAYELPGGQKGARAAHALGLAHGLTRGVLRTRAGLPLVEVTAYDAKRALAGGPNASKDAMVRRARAMWPQIDELPKAVREHAADAIGVARAAARTDVARAAMVSAIAGRSLVGQGR
jgi:Holliday junction resolvasome RuvABC endonuclease subunit